MISHIRVVNERRVLLTSAVVLAILELKTRRSKASYDGANKTFVYWSAKPGHAVRRYQPPYRLCLILITQPPLPQREARLSSASSVRTFAREWMGMTAFACLVSQVSSISISADVLVAEATSHDRLADLNV